MTVYETLSLVHEIGSRLDVQWGFFISIHLALLGGIIYVDRPLSHVEKAVAIAVYAGFALVNYFLSINQSRQLYAAYRQLEEMAATAGDSAPILLQFYGEASFTAAWDGYEMTTIAAHLVMGLVVIVSVLADTAKAKNGGSKGSGL